LKFGTCLKIFDENDSFILRLLVMYDELVVGTSSGTVGVWDLCGGVLKKEKFRRPHHSGGINCLILVV